MASGQKNPIDYKESNFGLPRERDIGTFELQTKATIDTTELFFSIPPRQLRTRIETVLQRRIKIRRCLDKTGFQRGVCAIVNRPTQNALNEIDDILRKSGGCISRCDLAVDFILPTEEAADALADFLDQHLVLKWRPASARKEHIGSTVYWAQDCNSRNLAMYPKARNIIRLELRFLRAASVHRAGLDSVAKIVSVSPAELMQKHFRLLAFKPDHVTKAIREAVRRDRQRHLKRRAEANGTQSHSAFRDLYQSRIASIVKGRLMKTDIQQFASSDTRRILVKLPMEPLLLPTRIEWPSDNP